MKLIKIIILTFCLLKTSISFSQPRYAPSVRAAKETQWMQDSLHLTKEQAIKAGKINLDFNKQSDKTTAIADTAVRSKKWQQLLHKKNLSMMAILNKEQYRKYLKREDALELLEQKRTQNKGPHRPL